MTADKVVTPAPAPVPQQKTDTDLKICEEIRKRVSLTPPSIVDALCKNEPTPLICVKAVYIEEVHEIAHALNRSHLLRFEVDCK